MAIRQPKPPPEAEVLTLVEAADYLRISERTLHTLLPEIPHRLVGRQYRFLVTDLRQYLSTQPEGGVKQGP